MSDDVSTVEYREIQGYPGYRVGNDGTVWSCRNTRGRFDPENPQWRKLSLTVMGVGYHQVTLNNGAKRTVHSLVLEAFVGPRPHGMVARHFPDRTKTNNSINNLSWATETTNAYDKNFHGTMPIGEDNGYSKLTAKDVREIRERLSSGDTHVAIAKSYGVSRSNIGAIANGLSWRHLDSEVQVSE